MLVDVYASYPHYLAHLEPIWRALPDELRGSLFTGSIPTRSPNACLVAGWKDARMVGQYRSIIYVEHGAGQTYQGDPNPAIARHPSYSGNDRIPGVIGYICPSHEVARRWTNAPAVAVGCPKMDRYHGIDPSDPSSVCFTFHWPGTLCPENGSAWEHYRPRLRDIVEDLNALNITVYGHSHPRWEGFLDYHLYGAGMTILSSDDDVFRTAGTLVADNTSLTPEFASMGSNVILLNAPWYRRDVEHGGRFWEWEKFVGSVDSPEELLGWSAPVGVHRSLALADHVYAHNDGHASQRAADAIVGWVDAL